MEHHPPTPLLDSVFSPVDLKKLPREALPDLAAEMRQVILDTVSPNLQRIPILGSKNGKTDTGSDESWNG